MKTIFKSGMKFVTKDGEVLNVRVYSDGWVKIEGLNMRKDFNSQATALEYANKIDLHLYKS